MNPLPVLGGRRTPALRLRMAARACALCMLCLAPVSGRGQVPQSAEANPDSALAETLARLSGTPLSLGQAVQSALAEATEARLVEAELLAARGAVRRETGAFDPELFGSAQRTSTDQPTDSFFAGADLLKTDETNLEAGARITLPLGTELTASLNTNRLKTNSDFAFLSPKYDTVGKLELRQPLMKGYGPATRGELTAAERELEAADERYQDAVLKVQAAVEAVYWELYAAERDYAVQQLIRERAAALLSEVKLRAAAGLVGPNQVANARVFLAEQEQAVLDQEERLDRESDRLATLMGRRPAAGLSRFHPTQEPPRDFPPVAQDSLVAMALRRNHDLRAVERRVAASEERARMAGWNALPSLDLFGSLGGAGLSGTGRDVVFGADTLRTTVSGGFGDSFRQVRNRDFPSWNIGVEFSLPLGNRAAGGEHDRLRAEVVRARQELIAAQRQLEEEVRAQHRELTRGQLRLQLAKDGVDASYEQVRIGLLEYKSGRTTAFELVRLGADLATAQRRYSEALVRTAKAAAELRRLTAAGYPDPDWKETRL